MRLSHCEACDILCPLFMKCVCVWCAYMFTCIYVSVHIQGQRSASGLYQSPSYFFSEVGDKVLHWSWRLLSCLNCLNTDAQRSSCLCPTQKINFPRLYPRVASHEGRMQFLQVFLLPISLLTWESWCLPSGSARCGGVFTAGSRFLSHTVLPNKLGTHSSSKSISV